MRGDDRPPDERAGKRPAPDPAAATTQFTQVDAGAAAAAEAPELLAPRVRESAAGSSYAPPAPVRRRRLSATARFYLGFWIVTALVLAASLGIGYRLGASQGAAAEHGAVVRALGIEAQCLRDLKLVASNPVAGSHAPAPALEKAFNALVGANHCAQTGRLPYLSQADLEEITGVKLGSEIPLPGDERWSRPEPNPPKAGAASGITVRGGF